MRQASFVFWLGVVLAAASADAQEPARTEVTLDRARYAWFLADFGGPLGATAGVDLLVGLGADVRDEKDRVKAVCAAPLALCAHGFLIHAAAGSGGGRLGIGIGARASVDSEGFHGGAGVALRLTVAQTWGSPIGTVPGLTYLGPELDLTVWHVGLTLGTLWRVAGDGGDGWVFSWGVGFRL
ncbi:MAG TPA: hypothetical protein VEQ10_00200 [Vicinamibacteria bacterium]|nr:hypothetical protein [Vicinamibacteria bacterium]